MTDDPLLMWVRATAALPIPEAVDAAALCLSILDAQKRGMGAAGDRVRAEIKVIKGLMRELAGDEQLTVALRLRAAALAVAP